MDLHFFEKQLVENCPLIDLLNFDNEKSKLDDKFKIYYDKRPCNIYIKNVAATIIKGNHLKRYVYLQIMSIGLSSSMDNYCNYYGFNKRTKWKFEFFVDSINCNQRLSLNKITYFDDIVIRFDSVEEIVYRGRAHYLVNGYVCKSKIMLSA